VVLFGVEREQRVPISLDGQRVRIFDDQFGELRCSLIIGGPNDARATALDL
jgi:hypothetical protein